MTDPSRVEPIGALHYPESDGEPMGESDRHIDEMIAIREALEGRVSPRSKPSSKRCAGASPSASASRTTTDRPHGPVTVSSTGSVSSRTSGS